SLLFVRVVIIGDRQQFENVQGIYGRHAVPRFQRWQAASPLRGPDGGLSGWPEVSRNPGRGARPTADECQRRRQPRMGTCPPQLFSVVVKSVTRRVTSPP